ncbi:DUF1090 domain-containing protein [Orbus sturtevantii]|uniref:DUF1090 domain-containing protein n=1 Tax=Orbus sturtevantii TaxID=3074109 RepID=UPI00370DB71C
MNKVITVSFITLATVLSFNALANSHDYDGSKCSEKKIVIQTQIDYAKKANNIHRVQGLEKALSDVNTYCTDEGLEKKYQQNVQDKLKDVQEKQADLQQAKLKGDVEKISKQQAKLAEKQQELQDVTSKLDEFYKAVKSEQ